MPLITTVIIPVAVVVELVVTGVGQVHSEARAARVEDLHCSIDPNRRLGQDLEVRDKIVLKMKMMKKTLNIKSNSDELKPICYTFEVNIKKNKPNVEHLHCKWGS